MRCQRRQDRIEPGLKIRAAQFPRMPRSQCHRGSGRPIGWRKGPAAPTSSAPDQAWPGQPTAPPNAIWGGTAPTGMNEVRSSSFAARKINHQTHANQQTTSAKPAKPALCIHQIDRLPHTVCNSTRRDPVPLSEPLKYTLYSNSAPSRSGHLISTCRRRRPDIPGFDCAHRD